MRRAGLLPRKAVLQSKGVGGMSVPPVQDAMAPLAAAGVGANTNPVTAYLARLAPGSRCGQLDALNMIARLLTKGSADAEGVSWANLKYSHCRHKSGADRAVCPEHNEEDACGLAGCAEGMLAAWSDGP